MAVTTTPTVRPSNNAARPLVARPAGTVSPAVTGRPRPTGPGGAPVVPSGDMATFSARVAQPIAPKGGTAATGPERPEKFKDPEEFRNFVIKQAGFISLVKAEVEKAQAEVDEVRNLVTTTETELRRPLDIARTNLTQTTKLYQEPIDRFTGELRDANGALDQAVNPGRARGATLEAEAATLGQNAANLDRQLRAAKERQAGLEGNFGRAAARRKAGEDNLAAATTERARLEGKVEGNQPIDQQVAAARNVRDSAERVRQEASAALARGREDDSRNLASLDATARSAAELYSQADGEVDNAEARLARLDGLIGAEMARREAAEGRRRHADQEVRHLEPLSSPSALDAQRSRVSEADRKGATATEKVTQAMGRVSRKDALTTAVSELSTLKTNYDGAVDSRSSYKGHVATKKAALDAAKAKAPEMDAQKAKVREAEARLTSADGAVSAAQAKVTKHGTLGGVIDRLTSLKGQIDHAENSRSGFKGQVTRKQKDLDEAMVTKDGAKITAAKSAHTEALQKFGEADGKVKALEGQASSLGANASNIDAVIAAKKSELSGLSGAPADLERARSARASAASALQDEQRKLSGFDGVASAITAAKSEFDEMSAKYEAADGRVRQMEARMGQLGANKDNLASVLSSRQSELSNLSGAPAELERAQGEARTATDEARNAKTRLDELNGLSRELATQRAKRDDAARDVETANRDGAALTGERSRLRSDLPGLQSDRSERLNRRDNARLTAERERSRQTSSSHRIDERERLSSAEQRFGTAQARFETLDNLGQAIAAQRNRQQHSHEEMQAADATTASLKGEQTQLPTTITQLANQLETTRSAQTSTLAEAKRERERQNPADHPQVKTAKGRVDDLTKRLAEAKTNLEAQLVAPRAAVASTEKAYAEGTSAARARAAAAGPAVDTARARVTSAQADFDALPTAVGGFTKFWWKNWHHFDVRDFMKTQAGLREGR